MVDKQDREKDTVLAVRSEDPLSYVNFGELIRDHRSKLDVIFRHYTKQKSDAANIAAV